MKNLETERCCDQCAVKDGNGKIIGGKFCVKLSALFGNKEEFKERIPTPPEGFARFWSSQKLEEIKNCPDLQRTESEQKVLVAIE